MATLLARHRATLDGVMGASREELEEIDGIGPEVARSVHHFFAQKENREAVRRLLERDIQPQWEHEAPREGPFQGKTVVFTGTACRNTQTAAGTPCSLTRGVSTPGPPRSTPNCPVTDPRGR